MIDQSAALAAHARARMSLPASAVHRIRDDDPPPPPPDVRQRGAWAKYSRPDWLPAIGERCVLVGGQLAGATGVAGPMRGSREAPTVLVTLDDGRKRYPAAEFVRPEGTPVPAVPIRHRTTRGRGAYLAGDRLRIVRGPRAGVVVTYIRLAGRHSPGRATIRILLPHGGIGTVLADCVEPLA